MIENVISVSTYIKKPNEKIVDLNDPQLKDKFINSEETQKIISLKNKLDTDYLDGFISIIYNDEIILGPREWDLVDQLWSYILDMILKIGQRSYAYAYFPDQPLKISFTLQGNHILFELYDGEKKYLLPKRMLLKKLTEGAYNFFTNYQIIFADDEFVEFQFKKIKEIQQYFKREGS